MELDPLAIRQEVLALVPEEICRRYRLLPLDRMENDLMVAMADTHNAFAMDDIKFLTGLNVVPVPASESAIADALDAVRWTGVPSSISEEPEDDDVVELAPVDGSDDGGEAPVVRVVNKLLLDAVRHDATAVHLNPVDAGLRVSFRIDETLREIEMLPRALMPAVLSRLKIMAKLDVAERQLPQDGRLGIRFGGGEARDFSVCTLPTRLGERISLRLIELRKPPRELGQLGLAADDLLRLQQAARITSGLLLIAGPPRSGRGTTIHALLRDLNTVNRCILAVGPAQYQMDGVAQTEPREAIGFTYAAAVRSCLRHDPDLIMVDRLRDEETAALLLGVASSGIAALTSITAEGAPEALLELARLGGGPAPVAAAVRFVAAQRLVRQTCDRCRVEDTAAGCDACGQSGYRGRLPIFELLPCSEAVRTALTQGADRAALRRVATSEGMTPFAAQAMKAAAAGLTTRDEYWRIAAETEPA